MRATNAAFADDTKPFRRPWLEAFITAVDDRLRRRHGVFEYSPNSDCIFRIELTAANRDLLLSDGVAVRAGDRIVNLHVWNEQFPAFPAGGPTLRWARRINGTMDSSLRELAHFLDLRRDLDDVVAIFGSMAFGSPECRAQLVRYVGHFGFEPVATARSLSLPQRLHRLGENILIGMMILARNAAALRSDTLRHDRVLVACSRRKLQRRYGLARDRAA